jgi:hypothetical protein
MFAGAAAVSFRKGSRWHGKAGNIFVADAVHGGGCLVPGVLEAPTQQCVRRHSNDLYGVRRAWATARRRDGGTGILDWLGCLFALTIGVLSVIHGFRKATGRAPFDGSPGFMDIFMRSVILLAGIGDLRMLVRGISGKRRIARHLWRMCFGWFIATGSFFLGQQQVFPARLRGSPVLLVPALLPLALPIFWLIRVRFTNAYKKMSIPRAGRVYSLGT